MKKTPNFIKYIALMLVLVFVVPAFAQGLKGWEKESAFDNLYDTSEFDTFKGYFVTTTSVAPLKGMEEGVAVQVRDRADDEIVTVILGPKAYVGNKLDGLHLRPGLKVKCYGAWAGINGKDMMIATKIKVNDKIFLKVRRTSDGIAYWNMSPEELKHELSQKYY